MLTLKSPPEKDGRLVKIYKISKLTRIFLTLIISAKLAMAQTEIQPYEIVENIADIEIRYYPAVMMAKYKSKNPGAGFGKLFNYISGNNNTDTKIAMTTPVHIQKNQTENSMSFVLPKKFNIDNAPLPNDSSLEVFEGESAYFATIRYSGYTNESKEKVFSKKLQSVLKEVDIKVSGEPVILVYNSPYKLINRRNEIIIPVIYNSSNNNE
jgi:hypothetical protein